MSELVFAATNYKQVEAICCLRYLRAQTQDGDTVYFEAPGEKKRQVPGPPKPPDRLSFTEGLMEALRAAASLE